MVIRLAKKEDINKILELLSEVLEIHATLRADVFISGTTKYTKEEIESIIANPSTPVFVADDDGVKGYGFCVIKEVSNNNMHKSKTLFIDDLCVEKSSRNKGIGKRIYEYLNDYAKEINCDNITLNVWQGNEEAISFYNKLGFNVRRMIMEKKVDYE